MMGSGLLDRQAQLICLHLRDQGAMAIGALHQLGIGAEAIEKIRPHRRHDLDRSGGGLAEFDQTLDAAIALLRLTHREQFLKLVNHNQPEGFGGFQSLDHLEPGIGGGGAGELRLGLGIAATEQTAVERLKRIAIGGEQQTHQLLAPLLLKPGHQSCPHHGGFATPRCPQQQDEIRVF